MTVSVIIPSFRRPHKLSQCLLALKEQTQTPDELIIIFSKQDTNTVNVVNEIAKDSPFPVEKILLSNKEMNSLAHVLNQGLKLAKSEVVIFTDDDAIPAQDWIYRIVSAYKINPSIGGVGGRDVIYKSNKEVEPRMVRTIGKLTWFGRIIGNHHEIVDKPQEVDFLKGCNMSFKRELIGSFDEQVIGLYRGEQDLCFKVKAQGYKLWYDPEIRVKHLKVGAGFKLAPTKFRLGKVRDFFVISHNTTYVLLKYLSFWKKLIFLAYTFLVGQRNNLGFLRSALLLLCYPQIRIFDLTSACLIGKMRGIATFFKKYS